MISHREAVQARLKLADYCLQQECSECVFYDQENEECMNARKCNTLKVMLDNLERLEAEEKE